MSREGEALAIAIATLTRLSIGTPGIIKFCEYCYRNMGKGCPQCLAKEALEKINRLMDANPLSTQ